MEDGFTSAYIKRRALKPSWRIPGWSLAEIVEYEGTVDLRYTKDGTDGPAIQCAAHVIDTAAPDREAKAGKHREVAYMLDLKHGAFRDELVSRSAQDESIATVQDVREAGW